VPADWENKLYFRDNLEIIRSHISDGDRDLIYLDAPSNSKVIYNVFFKERMEEPRRPRS
jgi:site-specific DNA-methyltransferase (adenine-specific)